MQTSRMFLNVMVLVFSLNIEAGLSPNIFRSHGKIILTASLLVMTGGYYLSTRKKEAVSQQPTPSSKEKIDDQKREERFRAYLGFDHGWIEPHPQTRWI